MPPFFPINYNSASAPEEDVQPPQGYGLPGNYSPSPVQQYANRQQMLGEIATPSAGENHYSLGLTADG